MPIMGPAVPTLRTWETSTRKSFWILNRRFPMLQLPSMRNAISTLQSSKTRWESNESHERKQVIVYYNQRQFEGTWRNVLGSPWDLSGSLGALAVDLCPWPSNPARWEDVAITHQPCTWSVVLWRTMSMTKTSNKATLLIAKHFCKKIWRILGHKMKCPVSGAKSVFSFHGNWWMSKL